MVISLINIDNRIAIKFALFAQIKKGITKKHQILYKDLASAPLHLPNGVPRS